MPASTEGTKPTLRDLVWLHHRRRSAPAAQMLWSKLEEDASLFLLSAQRDDLTDQEKVAVEQCRQKLELAKSCIDRVVMRPTAFWQIIHEVDALLVMIIPREKLASWALTILQKFEMKVTDPVKRKLWLGEGDEAGPLRAAVKTLTQGGDASRARSVLSGALDVLNEQVDQGFWELNSNVSIQVFSALLLLGLFAFWWLTATTGGRLPRNLDSLFIEDWNGDIPFMSIVPFVLFGIAGATISNMLSKQPFVIAIGSTVRFYAYNLLVKPLLGGFAALFLLIIERSDVLFAVVLREGDLQPLSRAAIQIQVNSMQSAVFTLAMLALGVGFFANRFLSSMMDQVQELLFKKSDKGQSSTPSTPATPSGTAAHA